MLKSGLNKTFKTSMMRVNTFNIIVTASMNQGHI